MAMEMQKVEPTKMGMTPMEYEGAEKEEVYPSIHLSLKDIPAAKDWPMNGEYRIVIEGELISMMNREGEGHIEIAMHSIGSEPMKNKDGRVSRKKERTGSE
jgi:hypothetical protein